jgi:hypothetical protein
LASNTLLSTLLLNIESNSANLQQGLDKANSTLNNFGSRLTGIASKIGLAFGIKEVLQFGFEVSKLAGEAAGVSNAFNKLESSKKLLADLKEATHGTVSELDLMKRAVQFSNFGRDLGQLPKLLDFATKRANATGQSVDYLVDSIVTGLGRKSVLILDNLGISSQQLNKEIEKTGDFFSSVGTIVDAELKKMGEATDNNLTRTQKLSASFENLKVALGDAANNSDLLGGSLDALSGTMDLLASKNLSLWDKMGVVFGGVGGQVNAITKDVAANVKKISDEEKNRAQVIAEVDRYYKEFNGDIEAYSKAITTHILKDQLLAEFQKRLNEVEIKRQSSIENIANLTERLNGLQEKQKTQTGNQLALTNQEISLLEKKIKLLKEVLPLGKSLKPLAASEPVSSTKFSESDLGVGPKANTEIDFSGGIKQVKEVNDGFQSMAIWQDVVKNNNKNLSDGFISFGQIATEQIGDIAVGAMESLGDVMVKIAGGQADAFKALVLTILQGVKRIILAYQAEAIAAAIKANAGAGPIIGLVLAGAAVAAVTAMFSRLPSFEKGGKYQGGTLALVGESGPELINFNRSGHVYTNGQTKDILSGGGNSMNIAIELVQKGEDLIGVIRNIHRKRGVPYPI